MLIIPLAFIHTSPDPRVLSLSKAFREAARLADLSQKAIAIDEGTDEAHLSQQINAHGLNLHRLLLIRNKTFWLVFLRLLANIVDCADVLVNPLAKEIAADVSRDVKVLSAKLAAMEVQLNAMSERRSA